MKILVIGIIILQLNFSCSAQHSTTELKNHFSSDQISDLNKITEFFKNEICSGKERDFKKCYEKIPHDYLYATGNEFWNNIDFSKQKELYNQISKSTFEEIWSFCKTTYPDSGKTKTSICAVPNGKYQKYLSELGKNNPKIAEYAKRLNDLGDFGFGLFHQNIASDKKNFDLNNPNIQLVVAIHFLTLNDQEKRNEQWNAE
ncbi:hypothetical protein [Salegentibacter flavus]|uniref:Uncharacterized protein n=1 Tax=Salegentibacter flavus TaxID=287099 RepID=A0A1I5DIH5_9FLAO|nr:hypothetical protein [Salegentibacter flavus]SFN99032.1 hypothetical protein SAMN05660413_03348 [Salegentibacter flavus]